MSSGDESEWVLQGEDAKQVIRKALDLGINFFDTADVYSEGLSERILGDELEGRGEEVVVASKVGMPFGSGPDSDGLSTARIRNHLKAERGFSK